MLKADPKEALKAYIDLNSLKIKFIEVYMLEIDQRGYIKHIKRRQITLICILVYMLEIDQRGYIKHIKRR